MEELEPVVAAGHLTEPTITAPEQVYNFTKYMPESVLADTNNVNAYLLLESVRLQRSIRNYAAAIFWVPFVASVIVGLAYLLNR